MSAGKVVAGCAGVFLLLPGLCFFGVGLFGLSDKGSGLGMMIEFIIIGIVILGGAVLLIRAAFRPPVVKIKHPTEPEPPKTE